MILEWTFSLSLQHNLMRLATNPGSNHGFERFCFVPVSIATREKPIAEKRQILTDRITAQTRDSSFCSQTVVDVDNDHGLRRARCSSSNGFLLFLFLLVLFSCVSFVVVTATVFTPGTLSSIVPASSTMVPVIAPRTPPPLVASVVASVPPIPETITVALVTPRWRPRARLVPVAVVEVAAEAVVCARALIFPAEPARGFWFAGW